VDASGCGEAIARDTAGARVRVKEQRPALVTRLRWQWHLRNGPYAAAGVVVAVSWTTAIKNTGATGQYDQPVRSLILVRAYQPDNSIFLSQ